MTRIATPADDALVRKLSAAVEGTVMGDAFSRGRYATDASIYQMMPKAVVVPRSMGDVSAAMQVAREAGVPVLPRGGGTSQCGQTVNEAVVLDLSKHLNAIVSIDAERREAVVEPGLVLDHLNAALKPHGLWYPVDVSTSSRATLGGMTANNSCGSRSLRYGTSRDNVLAIDALMADGTRARFGEVQPGANLPGPIGELARDLLAIGAREADEIAARFPDVYRRVGGYNLDALVANGRPVNLAHLLVGSEGTLAFSERITLKLSPLPRNKVLGVCHFPSFYKAMDAAQHLVKLDPTAIELVDATMIALARDIPIFRPVVEEFVRGAPEALLIVEFAEDDQAENLRRLAALHDVMADLGFRWDDPGKAPGGVVEAIDPAFQSRIIEVRKQGLNIMMSMKSEGKPVSFVEDCCVRLADLAEYTDRLTAIFRKHGTNGTWYAHASVGTLHVRPVLNLKQDLGVSTMRAIAEEAFEMVRGYKGSHSGEHGDGIVRSEFHRQMFGERIVAAFEEVKDRLDPGGLMNPGKIVRPPKMDDRSLMRFDPGYTVPEFDSVFRWEGHHGAGRGLQGAVEMCNNNGACRKTLDGVMCPSYRVTRDERDLTRGRANTLRLAISGQLGPDAFTSDEMAETMKLCVSCKACRRECPTGVDMAKMKIEVQAARARRNGVPLRERLVGHMPRYARIAARLAPLVNLRNRIPALRRLSERALGFAAERDLPEWRGDWFRTESSASEMSAADVVLFADCFNRYFEPQNLRAAEAVLKRAGLRVAHATAPDGSRPLCCGRTYLSAGMATEAKAEMARTAAALRPALENGASVVGLEPSCLLTFRDEAPALLDDWSAEFGARVMLFEEFLAARAAEGRLALPLAPLDAQTALLHGHCHQKAMNVMGPVQKVLGLVPGLKVELIASSCCGMAGAFGYQAETVGTSRAMAELSLLPRVRAAGDDAIVVADGTSCRHQIADGAGRAALHVARVLEESSKRALT
ncbi:FAD-binding protein [Limibaculum sp. M0105]|uniref:FAD-binding protein n=1 Tax=Thermohalobaculum xanthum TaxID=2753746 RepID=A0A8J7SGQ6_9RHOB|nr:FAD-binding and (Fe-S)-binding domain-containing protein [Thermohalobaculum xanthum]MBK0400317.1 FAD-binding protein [Thermohalobaculum xanthum]